jgi:hypothetical protein
MSIDTRAGQVQASRVSYAGCARVALFLSVIGLFYSAWSLRSAWAQTELSLQRLGSALQAELGPSLVGEPETISINGQLLMVASRQSPLSVREVLDGFTAHCTKSPDAERALALPVAPSAAHAAGAASSRRAREQSYFQQLLEVSGKLGVLRDEREGEGHLVCFAREKERAGLAAVTRDLAELLESGDFSRLGDLRYVTARRHTNGKTHVLTVWSEGPLRVGALFPERGDAPGSDMAGVPRLPESTRELCAQAVRHSYALRLYRSARSGPEVLAFYDRELVRTGWQRVPTKVESGELRPGVFARAFVRDGRALALGVDTRSSEAGTGLSLIDLGTVAHSSAESRASLMP